LFTIYLTLQVADSISIIFESHPSSGTYESFTEVKGDEGEWGISM